MEKTFWKVLLSSTVITLISAGGVLADNVEIGFNVPLTGFAAADGKSALNGAKLAVKQANDSGGHQRQDD